MCVEHIKEQVKSMEKLTVPLIMMGNIWREAIELKIPGTESTQQWASSALFEWSSLSLVVCISNIQKIASIYLFADFQKGI